MKDLERERDLVQDQIVLAVKQLKDTEDVLNMFNDSKKVNLQKHIDSIRYYMTKIFPNNKQYLEYMKADCMYAFPTKCHNTFI